MLVDRHRKFLRIIELPLGRLMAVITAAVLVFSASPAPIQADGAAAWPPPQGFSRTPGAGVVPGVPISTAAPIQGLLQDNDLVDALREGGYVLYFRHASTERDKTDIDPLRLSNCLTQRNLSNQGREEARAIGEAFRALQIPVGQVFAGEYCRTRHTALMAFSWTEITESLTGLSVDNLQERKAALDHLLATPPVPGKNTILVGHSDNLVVTAGVVIAEGEAAVFSPRGADGYQLVARIQPSKWNQFVSARPSKASAVDMPGDYQVEIPSILEDDPDLLMPDLQTLPPSDIIYQVVRPNEVELLRLTNTISNTGTGPMEIQGIHQDETSTVIQRITRADGSMIEQVSGEFVFHPTHDHWHFEDFAHYELWSLTPAGELDSLVASSGKVSFCLRDNLPIDVPNAAPRPVYTICGLGIQGISVGWTDVYEYDLPDQTIDITNVPVGLYALRSVTDPSNSLWEVDDTNNEAVVYVEILSEGVRVVRDPEVLQALFVIGSGKED